MTIDLIGIFLFFGVVVTVGLLAIPFGERSMSVLDRWLGHRQPWNTNPVKPDHKF